MAEVESGFIGADGLSGADWLAHYGPALSADVGFDPDHDPETGQLPEPQIRQISALVDTGATDNSIDRALAERLGLPVVNETDFAGIGGVHRANMYAAQIYIPALNHIIYGEFAGVELSASGQQHEALIGRGFLRECRMMYDGVTGSVIISKT